MDHNDGASTNHGLDSASLMSLYIAGDANTSGTITIADNSFTAIPFVVYANKVTIVSIPPSAFLAAGGTFNKGVHIVTQNPVAIYAHIYAEKVSGATLLLPVNTLGNTYTTVNYIQLSNAKKSQPAYSAFVIVATEDSTVVKITPLSQTIDQHAPGIPFTVLLNKGQLYQGLSQNDLTGSTITATNSATGACAKVAVFSGSSRVQIGCTYNHYTSDNLFQQNYPVASWGKNFITVPLKNRNYDILRIIRVGSQPNVVPNIKVNGTSLPSFSNFYDFPSQQPNVITSDQPIQVVQYAVSQDNAINCDSVKTDIGDPEMIFITPLEQTLDHVIFYATGNFMITNSYVNVVLKTSAVNSFIADGNPYINFTAIPGNPSYSYAQIPVVTGPQNIQAANGTYGTHTLSAGDGFSAIAYGFGIEESYGYNAGANVENLSKNVTLANPANDTLTQSNGCVGVTYNLELTLPYATSNIVWDFKNGSTYTDAKPKPALITTIGSETLYHYLYQKPVTYNTPSNDTVTATVFDPVAGECGNYETIEFDYNIAATPTAAFNFTDVCLGDSTVFNDESQVNGTYIKTWMWNFGDNKISVLQNPRHLYAAAGSYNVKLTVTNENGCSSVSSEVVNISTKPAALFTVTSPQCAGQAVTITDASTHPAGKIIQWIWSYGDGKTDTLTNGNPFNHIYVNTGTDTLKLTVTSDKGCQAGTFKVLTINPAAVVDFTLPAVCQSDSSAQFFDKTVMADSSKQSFTYLWNFGDQNAGSNLNTSSLKNPSHKYSQAGNYNITLSVTTEQGCIYTKKQVFTVNGDIPYAKFSVENSANLCSSDSVTFDDLSSVNFGNIVKWVWYFDYNNHPADSVVFTGSNYPAGGKFKHSYGIFNSPLTKSYQVKLEVYSGISCISQPFVQSVTVNANPVVTLTVPAGLCSGGPAVQVAENKNGFSGTGIFTGTGITPTGLFDPSVSGNGVFTINYKFIAQNGCEFDTTAMITVSAKPVITLPEQITVLEGGEITIPAKASGDSLTYRWSPEAGLSNPDILNPVASPSVNTVYTLIVTNSGGCSSSAQILVSVLMYPVIPNTFTPNGDGINDYWDIKYLNSYPGNTVNIFDRYGRKVFTANGYGVPWDGTYNGAPLPTGVYYYIIDPKNGRKPIAGNVTIIR